MFDTIFKTIQQIATPATATATATPAATHAAAPEATQLPFLGGLQAKLSAAAAAAPPPLQAKPPAKLDQAAIDDQANTIFKKTDSLVFMGGEKHAILDTLRGKSPQELDALRKSYQEHFGRTLDADVMNRLDGNDVLEARLSLQGNPVDATVAALRSADTGGMFGGADAGRVKQVLMSITDPDIRAQVAQQMKGELSDKLGGNDRDMAQALLSNDTQKVAMLKIDDAMNGGLFGQGGFAGTGIAKDHDAVLDAIASCKDQAERDAMVAAYKAKSGKDLSAQLDAELNHDEKKIATATLAGDNAGASAARLVKAMDGFGSDKDAIYKQLDGKTAAERKAIEDAYQQQTGKDLSGELSKQLKDLDGEKAQALLKDGKLDDVLKLRVAMDNSFMNWFTDKSTIEATLQGKSAAEIDALKAAYEKKYGVPLDTELGDRTSGRDGFEIKQLMKGEPVTLDDKVARAKDRWEFERGSGSNGFSNFMGDLFGDKGHLLDKNTAQIEQLYGKLKSGTASPDEQALLERFCGYQKLDTKNYQESKDAISNTAAAIGAVTIGGLAMFFSAGTATPLVAGALSAFLGSGSAMALHYAIEAGDYSQDDARGDLASVITSTVTGGLGSWASVSADVTKAAPLEKLLGSVGFDSIENPLARTVAMDTAKYGIASGGQGAANSAVAKWQQGGSGGDILGAALAGGGQNLLGGAVGGASGDLIQKIPAIEGLGEIPARYIGNTAGNVAGGAATTLANGDTYSGDSGSVLAKIGLGVGLPGIAGAAFTPLDNRQAAAGKTREQTADRLEYYGTPDVKAAPQPQPELPKLLPEPAAPMPKLLPEPAAPLPKLLPAPAPEPEMKLLPEPATPMPKLLPAPDPERLLIIPPAAGPVPVME